jgi:hypothetical protein
MNEGARPKRTPPDVEDIRSRAEAAVRGRFPGARLSPLTHGAATPTSGGRG